MKNIIKIVLLIICAYQLNAIEIKLFKSIEVNGINPKANDMFGWQVSVGEEFVFLTSPNDSSVKESSGSVYIYKKNDDSLNFYQKIYLEDSKQFTGFGNRISHLGKYLVVSSIGKVNTKLGDGYIHLFKHKLNKFEHVSTISATSYDLSPSSLDFDENYLALGQSYSSKYAKNGLIKLYALSDDKFELVQEITENTIKPLNHIGQSLALKNGILAFSSITADGAAEKTGAVWIYKLSNSKFEFLEKITPSDASTDDFFGASIAIDQDILAIGSMRHSPDKLNPVRSGAVYLYSFENDKYYFFNKIYPKESANDYDYFGSSLDIHNDVLVIGAHSDDEAGKNAGAVYVYNPKGNAWELSNKITKDNANSHNLFGASVSVFDDSFVCSSHLEEIDENSIDHGVAYYYNDNSTTSLGNESDPNVINIFPNPTDDFVNISLPFTFNIEKISLFDVTGKEISMINTHNYVIQNNLKEFTVDLKELPNSAYLIIINDKDRSYSFKVIKK